jgi:hypothetical protein
MACRRNWSSWQTVLDAFPKDLRHSVVTTSEQLDRILGSQQVDVVHIAAYVCPRSGALYFSHVDLPIGDSDAEPEDFIRASALALLLKKAGTRLVVIASGDSLALATVLLPQAHVISPRDKVTAKSMAEWVRTFYSSLRTKTLAEACEFAEAQSRASMKLLTQQIPTPLKIAWRKGDAP